MGIDRYFKQKIHTKHKHRKVSQSDKEAYYERKQQVERRQAEEKLNDEYLGGKISRRQFNSGYKKLGDYRQK